MGNEPLFVSIANLGKRLFTQPQQTQNQTPVPTPLMGQMNVDPASVTKKVFNDTRSTVRNLLGGEAEDKYIGINDPSKQQTVAFKTPNIDPTGMVGLTEKVGTKAAEPIFKGFTDISTKLLEKLKGRTTVSRQFIEDLTNQPDLKQAEKDLIRRVLGEESGTKVYHGTNETFDNFDPSKLGTNEKNHAAKNAFFFSDSKQTASTYGKNVKEAQLKFDNPVTIDAEGKMFGDVRDLIDETVLNAKKNGNDGVIIKNLSDEKDWGVYNPTTHFAVLDTKAIKPVSDQISVPDFANRVKSELLPLTTENRTKPRGPQNKITESYRYENVNLPDELRGLVANYQERIYQSPIKTSAGDVHFGGIGGSENYFAHTRIEDLPDNQTRRVIEAQSDLFQKGRLEGEAGQFGVLKGNESRASIGEEELARRMKVRDTEIAKLEPYRNTWHERVIREEVKQAAKDGKTKLQFPTGETAMKIEGLGDTRAFYPSPHEVVNGANRHLSAGELSAGKEIGMGDGSKWIITDVLGDGKFKAVPKQISNYTLTGGGDYRMPSGDRVSGNIDFNELPLKDQEHAKALLSEQFDISGKVDTENPIYKFYEKTVQKYLTNKYGGKVITDPQGVKWVEIDVKPEYKGLPIEAFGAGAIPLAGMGETSDNERRFKSTPVDTTSLFINTQ